MAINRRNFIKFTLGSLAAGYLMPAAALDKLAAAAEKAPAAAGTNPLFSGALGQYDNVVIYGTGAREIVFDNVDHGVVAIKTRWVPIDEFIGGDQWSKKDIQAAMKFAKDGKV